MILEFIKYFHQLWISCDANQHHSHEQYFAKKQFHQSVCLNV